MKKKSKILLASPTGYIQTWFVTKSSLLPTLWFLASPMKGIFNWCPPYVSWWTWKARNIRCFYLFKMLIFIFILWVTSHFLVSLMCLNNFTSSLKWCGSPWRYSFSSLIWSPSNLLVPPTFPRSVVRETHFNAPSSLSDVHFVAMCHSIDWILGWSQKSLKLAVSATENEVQTLFRFSDKKCTKTVQKVMMMVAAREMHTIMFSILLVIYAYGFTHWFTGRRCLVQPYPT